MIDTHVKIERSSKNMHDRISSNGSPFRIKPDHVFKNTITENTPDIVQGKHISLSNLLNEIKQPKIIHK